MTTWPVTRNFAAPLPSAMDVNKKLGKITLLGYYFFPPNCPCPAMFSPPVCTIVDLIIHHGIDKRKKCTEQITLPPPLPSQFLICLQFIITPLKLAVGPGQRSTQHFMHFECTRWALMILATTNTQNTQNPTPLPSHWQAWSPGLVTRALLCHQGSGCVDYGQL